MLSQATFCPGCAHYLQSKSQIINPTAKPSDQMQMVNYYCFNRKCDWYWVD